MSTEAPKTTREVAEAVLLDTGERGRLVAYARSRFGIGAEDAEDILQDTALELLRQRDYVRSPSGFVFSVFRNRCTHFLHRHRVRGEIFADGQTLSQTLEHPVGPEKMHRQVALRQALGEISTSCRRLLAAYYVEGQSLREAAEIFTLTYANVSKTINRCLRRLRQCLN